MTGIELAFEAFTPMFDFAPGVEAEVAETLSPYATAYMDYINAKPFGLALIHQRIDKGVTKTEKVEAFSNKQYLYVLRTIGYQTRVFKFFAPTGLLLSEAVQIVQVHQQMSTLDLIG